MCYFETVPNSFVHILFDWSTDVLAEHVLFRVPVWIPALKSLSSAESLKVITRRHFATCTTLNFSTTEKTAGMRNKIKLL